MLRRLIILFFFLPIIVYAEDLFLKERFRLAQPGNYIVISQNKNYTFLHIYDAFDDTVVLEEISVPAIKIPKNNSWKSWLENNAPGNTSWTMSEIDVNTGQIIDAYSFTRQGWLDVGSANSFISALLNLHFRPIPDVERKKIGPQPVYGKMDTRTLWNPRLILNGQYIPNVHFTAWRARWPNDGTELARKKIEIYLPELTDSNGDYPTYFPYWIDIEGKLGSAQVKVVDSGLNAISPQPPIYRTK